MMDSDHLFGYLIRVDRATSDGSDGVKFPLIRTPCFIGRDADCQIRLKNPDVCERHCMLKVSQRKKITVHSLNSNYAVLVNGVEVNSNGHPLKNDDVIQISDFRFRWSEVEKEEKSKNSGRLSFCPENTMKFIAEKSRRSDPGFVSDKDEDNMNTEAHEKSPVENDDSEASARVGQNKSVCSVSHVPLSDELAIVNETNDAELENVEITDSHPNEIMNESLNSTGSVVGNVSDIDLVIPDEGMGRASQQTAAKVLNSSSKMPKSLDGAEVSGCDFLPSSQSQECDTLKEESVVLRENVDPKDHGDNVELTIPEHVTPPKSVENVQDACNSSMKKGYSTPGPSNDKSRLQRTPESSAHSFKRLREDTPIIAESPSKFRGRRSTGILPCVGTPSEVYRIKRSLMATPAMRSSRSTVPKEAETSSTSRQPRRRSSERKSTPLKPRISDRCIQRESVLYSPIIEDETSEKCEESQNESLINDTQFKYVQTRRKRRFGGSTFTEENRILEESETSQNTTTGMCENTNADGNNEDDDEDEDESLMALNICDDSSAPMSARIVNGDQDAAENSSDIKEELNSTFTVDSAEAQKENSLAVEPQQTLKSILTPQAKVPFSYKEKSAKKVTFACNVIAESSNESSVDCTLQSTDSYNSATRPSLRSSVDSTSLCSQIDEGLDSFCQNEELFSEISRSSSVFSRNSTSTPVKSPRKSSLSSLRLKSVTRSLNDWGDEDESFGTRRSGARKDRSSAISQAEESMDDNVDLTELQEAEKEQCSGFSLTKTSGDRSTNSMKEMSHEFATPTCSKLVDSLRRCRSNSYLPDYTSEENMTKDLGDSTVDFDKTVDSTTSAFHSRKVTRSTGVTPLLDQMKLNKTTDSTGTPSTKFNVTTESAKRVSCNSTMAEKSVASAAGTPSGAVAKSERSFSFICLDEGESEPLSKSDVSTKAVAGTDDSEEARSETTTNDEVDVSRRKSSRLNSSGLSQIGRTPTSSRNTPYSTRTRRSSKAEYLEENVGTPRGALLDLKSPGPSKITNINEDVLWTDSNETANDLLKTPRRTMEAKSTPRSRSNDTTVTESTAPKSAESEFEPEVVEDAETQDILGVERMEEAETQNILDIEEAETQNILDIEDVDTQVIDEKLSSPKMSAPNVVEAETIRSTSEPEIMEEALTQLVTEKVSTNRFGVQDDPEEMEESQYLSALFSHESHVMEDAETQDVCVLSEKQNASAILPQAVEEDAETQDVVTHHSSEVVEDAETQDVCALLPQSSEGDKIQAVDLDEPELFSQSIEEYKTQDIPDQTPSRKASSVAPEEITEQNDVEEVTSENNFEDVDAPEAVENDNEDVVVGIDLDEIDDTETQDLVDERIAEIEETQTLQDEVVEIAGTQDLLDERMAGAETQCLLNEDMAEAETQMLQDEIVDEAETQTLQDEIVEEAETQYPLDEGILEADTQYLFDQGIVQAETQVLHDEVVDEAETQDLLDEETQDLLDERISEGETQVTRDEVVDEAETQDLLDERIAEEETQAMLQEEVVHVEEMQDLLDELVEEAATQDLLEEGIEKIEMPALIEENASQIQSNSSIPEISRVEANEITPSETQELDNAETETKASDVAEEPVTAESSSNEVEPSAPSAEVTDDEASVDEAKPTDVPNERSVESVDAASPEVAKENKTLPQSKPNELFLTPRPPRIDVTYHGTDSPEVRRSSRISHRRASKTPLRLDVSVEKSASKRTKKDRDNQENEDCTDVLHRRCSMCALNVSEPVSARKRQRTDEATPVQKRKRTPYKMDDRNETVTKTELPIPKLAKTQVDAETQTTARRSSPFQTTTPASEKKHRVLKKLDENSERPSSPHTIVLPVRQFNSTASSPINIEIPLIVNIGAEVDTPAPTDVSLPTAVNKDVVSAKRKRVSKKQQGNATVEASAVTQTVRKVPSPAAPAKPTRQQKASDTSDAPRTTAVAMDDAPTTQRASNVASSPPKVAETSTNKRGAKRKIAPVSPTASTSLQAASPKRTTRKRRNADADLASTVSPPKRTLRNRATNVVQSPAATVVEKKSKRGGGARGNRETADECVAAVAEPKGRTATRTKAAVVQPTVETIVEAVVEPTTEVKRAIRPKRFASPAEVQKKAIRGARQKAASEVAAEKAPPATSSRRPVSVEEETQPEPSQRSTRTKRGAAAVAPPPVEPEVPSAKRRAGKPAAATAKSVPTTSDAQLEKKSSTRTRTRKVPEENEPEPEPKTKSTRSKSKAKRAPVVDSSEEEPVSAPEPEPKSKSTRGKGAAKRAAAAVVDSSDEEPAQKSATRGGRTASAKRTNATKATKKNETAASSRGPSLTISRKSLTLRTVKFKSPIAHVKSSSDEEPRKKRAKTTQKANEEATSSKTRNRRSVKVVVGRSVTSTSKSSSRKVAAKDEARESPTASTVTRGARTRASTRVPTIVASTSRTTRRKQ